MPAALPHTGPDPKGALRERLSQVRRHSVALVAGLSEADCQAQSMPDASPAKWHLAHTTWFFETLVLERFEPGFAPHHPAFRVLFNSYYNGIGAQHPRAERGLITRPGLAEVLAYREAVDARLARLLASPLPDEAWSLLELGLQHEQQHQELLLADLLHLFSCNPLAPAYLAGWGAGRSMPARAAEATTPPLRWVASSGGLVEIGHTGGGFAFDNERPRHRQWLAPYALAQRLVTEGEWAEFVADGAYRDPRWWLSAGWDWLQARQLQAPLYWRRTGASADQKGNRSRHDIQDGQVFTLGGLRALHAAMPVAHLSAYEADAYARWWSAQHPDQAPARLPTEAEWEHAAQALGDAVPAGQAAPDGHLESGVLALSPCAAEAPSDTLQQMGGVLWQWTSSAYTAYPGFAAWAGAVGEYNGKFMINQLVLRGGSLASPRGHLRPTYRNFFPAEARWQFSGLRLARSA